MHSTTLAGRHSLPDGSTADVVLRGRVAEVQGTDPRGEASFTVTLPLDEAARLIGAAS